MSRGCIRGAVSSFQCAAAACVIAFPAASQAPATTFEQYLRTTVGLTSAQIDAANRGHALAKELPTDAARDVTIFGFVGIPTSRAAYASRMHNVRQVIGMRTPKFGIIGDPATLAHLQGVSVDSAEYRGLASCRPGDCIFKLPASQMRRLAEGVDWKSRDAKRQVDSLVRSDLKEFITRYRAIGNAAMVRYDDRNAVHSSDAFAALLGQSRYLLEYASELRSYLVSYPAGRPAWATDVLYWSETDLPRLRPTFTVNHMVIYEPPTGAAFVARKQIYANHYFEGAFELLAAFDAPSATGAPLMYLVSVRRYRYDNLPGGLLNVRGRVRDGLIESTRSDLNAERRAIAPALPRR